MSDGKNVTTERVRVDQLRCNDILEPTRNKVKSVSAGVRTPSGYKDVVLLQPNGATRTGIWRSSTMVTIQKRNQPTGG